MSDKKDMTDLFGLLKQRPYSVRHRWGDKPFWHNGRNFDKVSEKYPVKPFKVRQNFCCAGMVALDLERDKALIEQWKWLCLEAQKCDVLKEYLAWQDEGALNWAIRKLEMPEFVVDKHEWHKIHYFGYTRWKSPIDALEDEWTKGELSNNHVIHLAGRRKFWRTWKQEPFCNDGSYRSF
jgi:hypothetical protein